MDNIYKFIKEWNNGNCFDFCIDFIEVFGGEIYYNGDHAIVRLEDEYWDANGKVLLNYLPISEYGEHHIKQSPCSSIGRATAL